MAYGGHVGSSALECRSMNGVYRETAVETSESRFLAVFFFFVGAPLAAGLGFSERNIGSGVVSTETWLHGWAGWLGYAGFLL